MKGKNNKNNDNKQARKPVVSGELTTGEVLESAESNPTNDFMETPVSEPKKSVTLNDLAEIDPARAFLRPYSLLCPTARIQRRKSLKKKNRKSPQRSILIKTKMPLTRKRRSVTPVSFS